LTRFVILGREQPKKTGFDKTSIVCFIYEDRPGSLLQILQEFSFRYINLTKIASRPTKKGLGDYCFFIDMEGHIEDEVISSAIKCLECKIRKVKILGSYPRGK
ncbi:MAG: ACT domain-containing protein, partial [Actinomycetia bacterium]|nr:ACT domain-containing protein [Actinomycetes bacterium]